MASFRPDYHNKGAKSLPTPSMSPNDFLDCNFRAEQSELFPKKVDRVNRKVATEVRELCCFFDFNFFPMKWKFFHIVN